ncbi:hypothetical protein CR513_61162, partial [Mucuna pruriens]
MDGFSRYNQIKMAAKDMEKITFIALLRTFCYKVIVWATYQKAMVTLFYNMIKHKTYCIILLTPTKRNEKGSMTKPPEYDNDSCYDSWGDSREAQRNRQNKTLHK